MNGKYMNTLTGSDGLLK